MIQMNCAVRRSASVFGMLALALAWTPLRAQAPDPIRPDPQLTPGATVAVRIETLCTPGYTRHERYVPPAIRLQVFREYGLADAEWGLPNVWTRDYEVDHLIPLSLGGSNDFANL